ncbi:hypothetical protein BO70DRAFT_301477 [Aspergillus heteromorphus CBS 117.55]|uniref:NAD dependent epimerase/dehydratase n=1 Tax=Aspergillus heteromorphus CBS 117.55 TaxID=1448321 RepID=A0A317UZC6_9EURO|nr:uncharacterized protein BO70DRAFT_301477 [Aspergillus heteromorphus CBS 117.55]PWY66709.1 hypothetical protein BO70DRAFT_301477 [Aspergillus heteromorphus CBS 117.55]
MKDTESVLAQTNIDRRTCSRIEPMQVLVLGLCRTGTLSTYLALQTLGYPTYHMTSIMQNPSDAQLWTSALLGKHHPSPANPPFTLAQWDALLGHVSATTDIPAALFPEELTTCYPDAKVILTLRDPSAWMTSMQNTIMKQTYSPLATFLGWLDPAHFGAGNRMCRLAFDHLFDGDFERNGERAFAEHYERVRRVVPRENLLEWNPKEGWGPLCEFLGREVPDTEFPRANEKEVFARKARRVAWGCLGGGVEGAQGVVVVGVVGWC